MASEITDPTSSPGDDAEEFRVAAVSSVGRPIAKDSSARMQEEISIPGNLCRDRPSVVVVQDDATFAPLD
jgi:hypothetical protein